MKYYEIGERLTAAQQRPDGASPCAQVCTTREWSQCPEAEAFCALRPLAREHFTKVDTYPDYLAGTLVAADKKDQRMHKAAFYITSGRLYLVCDDDSAAQLLDKLAETRQWKTPSAVMTLFSMLNELIDDDMEYLEGIEDKLGGMEEAVLDHRLRDFNKELLGIRKELLLRARFYAQLQGLAQEFEEDESELFTENARRQFHLLGDRAARRESYCQALREYCVQIRDVYQAHVDLMQNNTMKVLTVVATIFMPLTLIVGWYGMNFSNMPELEWEYGYPFVIGSSLLVTFVTIWWFKKKNML
ncbi:MAG: CorA family divalent cation transporter [Oscillospiraceae bacterium]|nr:CorA family divalent cation transporter [Oscillospiraceae bacterium]